MKRTRNVIIMGGILNWLAKTFLVAALLAFSGAVSGLRTYTAEPVKTELREGKSVNCRKTVLFKKKFDVYSNLLFHSTSRVEEHASILSYQKNRVAVKLKCIFRDHSSYNYDKGFLLYQSTYDSDESDMSLHGG